MGAGTPARHPPYLLPVGSLGLGLTTSVTGAVYQRAVSLLVALIATPSSQFQVFTAPRVQGPWFPDLQVALYLT